MLRRGGNSIRPSLLFVTQVIDPEDPALGFAIGWARALAERCERLAIIANETRASVKGLEVHSLGKERGYGRAHRMAQYLALVNRLGKELNWTGLLAHMCPDYVTAAAPIAHLRDIPLWLWFAHPSDTARLKLAQRLATGILTSLPTSYPIDSPKTHVVGQATDLEALTLEPPLEPRRPLKLVVIGRSSPSKGFPTIIQAVALAKSRGTDLRVRLIAPATTGEERSYHAEIKRLIDVHRLSDLTTLEDGLPPAEIPTVLRESHALVNNGVSGTGDKVVFEAMASGRPVLVSNPSFRELLAGLRPLPLFPPDDAEVLSRRIEKLAATTIDQRATIGAALRRRVAEGHSLDHWADAVLSAMASQQSRR